MKKNMGNADRVIRVVLALLFIVLYSSGTATGTIGIVLLVLAGVFLITAFVGTCPLYMPFGLSTCAKK
jgi:K+-transporting ATPase A subunit